MLQAMTRPLRLEFPDAVYHVTLRGDRREAIKVNKLTWVRFVIALGGTLEAFLDGLLDLGQTFEAVLQRLEPLVGAVMRSKFL